MNDFNFQHKNIYQNQNNINNPQMNFNNNFNPNIIMNNNNIFSQNQNQMKSINEFNIQVEFKYEGRNIDIYSHVNDRVKEICQKFGIKVKKDIKNMQFLYLFAQKKLKRISTYFQMVGKTGFEPATPSSQN